MPFMRQRERDPLAHSNASTAQCGWHEEQKTLNQVYFRVTPKVQNAFRNLLIRGILQFTMRIAFRCVLHRYPSRGIHR